MCQPLTPESRAGQDGREENTLPPSKKGSIQGTLEINMKPFQGLISSEGDTVRTGL